MIETVRTPQKQIKQINNKIKQAKNPGSLASVD